MRNIPLLLRHYTKTDQPPECMALGFAAFLLFMKGRKNESAGYEAQRNGKSYLIQDDNAAKFADIWKNANVDRVVDEVLADKNLWGVDLLALTGFADAVKKNLNSLLDNGAAKTLEQLQLKKVGV